MLTTADKALGPIIIGLLSLAAAFGLDVSWANEALVAGVTAVLAGIVSYFLPNKSTE